MLAFEEIPLPPLHGILEDIDRAADQMVAQRIADMPAERVKQLVLDRLAVGALTGLSEPLGIEAQIAQVLRASLDGLKKGCFGVSVRSEEVRRNMVRSDGSDAEFVECVEKIVRRVLDVERRPGGRISQ